MRRSKPALTAGFCLPAAPRPAVCPVSVAPNAYACPAAGRLRRNRVVIWSRVVRVGITPAPTIAEPKSKPESGTPAAAPASMPVAAIRASAPPGTNTKKLKIRTVLAKNRVSPEIAAPPVPPRPFAKPILYHRRAGLYSHQQRICGTITGPLTRYSCASHERHCRLAFGPG